ncbi:ABC-2 transporter permease [bacterium]|nr:ABC-2 transporter permease [bacterium]
MVIALTVKDMRAYGTVLFLRMLPAAMIPAVFFIFRYYPWHVYMMYAYMTISMALIQFSIREIQTSHRILTLSLPVTRRQVVLSGYLSAFFIACFYSVFWYCIGIAAAKLFPNAITDFSNALHVKSLVITSTYMVLFISLFLPAMFACSELGTILAAIPAWVVAVGAVPVLFYPFEISYVPILLPSDRWFIAGLLLAAAVLVTVSISVSLKLLPRKDI